MTTPIRHRLPGRGPAETQEIAISDLIMIATSGFDISGYPAAAFLTGE